MLCNASCSLKSETQQSSPAFILPLPSSLFPPSLHTYTHTHTHTHTQGQALVVAGLATIISIVLGTDLAVSHMLLLGASAMGSAAIASVVLGSVMIIVILLSHHLRINPDNVATPIAASLGDLVTLGLLSVIARGLFTISSRQLCVCVCVCGWV